MEQNKKGKKAPTQPTIDPAWDGEINRTPEQALQSKQIQTNFQRLHEFSNAQSTQKGELPSAGENNPIQTGHKHNSRESFERLHPQRQMPGKDKHQPWGNAAFTHTISQITNENSSGYPASSRDNPLTARGSSSTAATTTTNQTHHMD
jgi:hypothetical protein